MKVLVVDDSKLARLSLMKVLDEYISKENCIQAANGEEAVSQMNEHKPLLVFLDLTMPIMDGYEALPKLLQSNPKAQVIVVSADIQESAQIKVLELGAKLHVKKPISAQKMQDIFKILQEK
jgi:two-component system, chemotaxis family, chemotaxis protein CheY